MTDSRKQAKPNKAGRRRIPVDDDLKAQLAIERYSGKPVEIRELARRHKRAEAVVSRAISSAFRERLVEVRRTARLQLNRVSHLEHALQQRFKKLRNAFVVEVQSEEPDILHEHLGVALAIYGFQTALHDGERILVGPGRSVFHVAEWLCNSPIKQRASGVSLIAACGDCYPYHDAKRNVCLDANANVNALARAFGCSTFAAMTSRPIFVGQSDQQWRAKYYGQFWQDAPTLGLLGLGILDAKHQLSLLTDPERCKEYSPVNVPEELRRKVQTLIELCEERTARAPSSKRPLVAELGLHLFLVADDDLRGGETKSLEILQARDLVREINQALFAPSFQQLMEVRSISLVAGGAAKARAISHVLEKLATDGIPPRIADCPGPSGITIQTLCTDALTADMILHC